MRCFLFREASTGRDDGGLIRGVTLLVTGAHFLDRAAVTARPILLKTASAGGRTESCRMEGGPAVLGVSVRLNCPAAEEAGPPAGACIGEQAGPPAGVQTGPSAGVRTGARSEAPAAA